MRTLQSYIKTENKGRIHALLQRAATLGLDVALTNGYAQKVCRLMQRYLFSRKMQRDAVFLHAPIEIRTLLEALKQKKDTHIHFEELWCGHFSGRSTALTHNWEQLDQAICHSMERGKIIFVMLDILDYCVRDINGANGYVAHSTCVILLPETDGYNCYYINSWGQRLGRSRSYETIRSRRRVKTLTFQEPPDVVFMRAFIVHLQQKYKQIVSLPITIGYDGSRTHTYLGADLQGGDIHGVCFAYPFVVWYYFGESYKSKRDNALKGKGGLEGFVETCFRSFSKYPSRELHPTIEKLGARFTKVIIRALVCFMGQPFFRNYLK